MRLTKYPAIPSILAFILVGGVGYLIWFVVNEQRQLAPIQVNQSTPILPVPLAAALIQATGLLLTILLAFFPIQSVAFHQGKKCLLDELLRLLSQYESEIEMIFELYRVHQTGACGVTGKDFEKSRVTITLLQKRSQALRGRIERFLPTPEAERLSTAALTWWNGMLGDESFVMRKAKQWSDDDVRFTNLWAVQFKFLEYVSALRQDCIFDEIVFWDLTKSKSRAN